jgi:hypothetical protein
MLAFVFMAEIIFHLLLFLPLFDKLFSKLLKKEKEIEDHIGRAD